MFETDYPHSDGTFPHSRKVAHELFVAAGMDAEDCHKVLRGNAIEAYGLAPLRHHAVVAPRRCRAPTACSATSCA